VNQLSLLSSFGDTGGDERMMKRLARLLPREMG